VTAAEVPAEPAPAPPDPVRAAPKVPDPRIAEAVALSAAALRLFLKDDHARAREVVERALALDPANRRARELQKILRVLG
jgi:hypothetical protein